MGFEILTPMKVQEVILPGVRGEVQSPELRRGIKYIMTGPKDNQVIDSHTLRLYLFDAATEHGDVARNFSRYWRRKLQAIMVGQVWCDGAGELAMDGDDLIVPSVAPALQPALRKMVLTAVRKRAGLHNL